MKDFIVVVSHKSKLEAILSGIYRDALGFCGTIQAVDDLALDAGKVDRLIKGFDDSVITVDER